MRRSKIRDMANYRNTEAGTPLIAAEIKTDERGRATRAVLTVVLDEYDAQALLDGTIPDMTIPLSKLLRPRTIIGSLAKTREITPMPQTTR